MSKGRKPLPTNLKLLKGTAQPCRMNSEEPTPDTDNIRMPTGLSPDAKRHWKLVCRQLKDANIITNVDVTALAMYCEAFAQWHNANQQLQKYGAVIKDRNGFPVQSPFFKIAAKSFDQMKALLVEFGMTPSSRTRVKATKDADSKQADPFANLSLAK